LGLSGSTGATGGGVIPGGSGPPPMGTIETVS
jgi:hypothetical protein